MATRSALALGIPFIFNPNITFCFTLSQGNNV
jgi:hypothetical protein